MGKYIPVRNATHYPGAVPFSCAFPPATGCRLQASHSSVSLFPRGNRLTTASSPQGVTADSTIVAKLTLMNH